MINLAHIYQLCADDNEDKAGDIVLDVLENDLRNARFVQVNKLLDEIDVDRLTPSVVLTILTITFWGKQHLYSRPKFLQKCELYMRNELGEERAEKLLEERR